MPGTLSAFSIALVELHSTLGVGGGGVVLRVANRKPKELLTPMRVWHVSRCARHHAPTPPSNTSTPPPPQRPHLLSRQAPARAFARTLRAPSRASWRACLLRSPPQLVYNLSALGRPEPVRIRLVAVAHRRTSTTPAQHTTGTTTTTQQRVHAVSRHHTKKTPIRERLDAARQANCRYIHISGGRAYIWPRCVGAACGGHNKCVCVCLCVLEGVMSRGPGSCGFCRLCGIARWDIRKYNDAVFTTLLLCHHIAKIS